MKPILTFLIIAILSFTLAACATTGTSTTTALDVKCPACGHEFEYETVP